MENLQSLREGLASGRLKGQKELKISDDLTEFPTEVLALAESLELLVLSGNKLRSLPQAFSQLKQLKIAFFNNNLFESFPAVLAECPKLEMISFKSNQLKTVPEGVLSPIVRWLILTDNQISALPSDIGKLSRLQKLMLAGNALRSLPPEMANCKRLELIRLSANQLTAIPDWLLSLPRLSWLAYAGNPFCKPHADRQDAVKQDADKQDGGKQDADVDISASKGEAQRSNELQLIDEGELTIGEVLGQGASGVIYAGKWQEKTVAVKLFKGDITSDGLPMDEMRACIAAGHHPNLVNVLGKLDAKNEQSGLIFSFITPEYHNLGGPPSLDSCTRDTYGDEVSFSLDVVLKIASGIAGAIAHLHQSGITHGDLYAHNILINEVGESILGDFGAASFLDGVDNGAAEGKQASLKRLESRAFGCLLEDLLDRCLIDKKQAEDAAMFKQLRDFQMACLNENPQERPLFEEICTALKC